jgi:hypothetical protein
MWLKVRVSEATATAIEGPCSLIRALPVLFIDHGREPPRLI